MAIDDDGVDVVVEMLTGCGAAVAAVAAVARED